MGIQRICIFRLGGSGYVEGDVTVIPTPEKEIPKDDSTSAAKTGDSVSIQILAGTLLISILGIGILRKKKQS